MGGGNSSQRRGKIPPVLLYYRISNNNTVDTVCQAPGRSFSGRASLRLSGYSFAGERALQKGYSFVAVRYFSGGHPVIRIVPQGYVQTMSKTLQVRKDPRICIHAGGRTAGPLSGRGSPAAMPAQERPAQDAGNGRTASSGRGYGQGNRPRRGARLPAGPEKRGAQSRSVPPTIRL